MKKSFNFRKFIKRNDFTSVFGNVGGRRTLKSGLKKYFWYRWKKFKMQQVRRAKQGWRNRVFGSKTALRIRKTYGRRPPISLFRR
jgi:hypothetical protein